MQESLSAFGAKRTSRRSNRLLDSQTRFAKRATKATLNRGAPRSMKMGTTRSPWPYDAAAYCALRSSKLRLTTIWCVVLVGGCLPDSAGGSGYPPIAALTIEPQIDVMCQFRP
jgi:hypothetical protein